MVKPGALLLLLAVAASQVDHSLSQATVITNSGDVNITDCPISYYGLEYSWLNVTLNADKSVDICFTNGPGQTSQDCLVWEDRTPSDSVEVETAIDVRFFSLVTSLPNIVSSSTCKVVFQFKEATSNQVRLELFKVAHQTALRLFAEVTFTGTEIKMKSNVLGTQRASKSWTKVQAINIVYEDLSGCRHSGVVALPGTPTFTEDKDTCVYMNCGTDGNITYMSTCGVFEVCEGNNTCSPVPIVCTATGSSVVDFFGGVQTVEDKCGYALMTSKKSSVIELIAFFNEQRRKDVTLLDRILIRQRDGVIILHQDGRVTVSDQEPPELNDTPQLFFGVALSKDQTGITAKLPPAVSDMTVFFDGNTAHVSGLFEEVTGLCGHTADPSSAPSLTDEKNSDFSADGCETQYTDDPDSTIDCTLAAERCELLNQAPFTACHDGIDPEPFITACTNTSCNYPMVDGLNCQFLEAYADACFLKDNITLEWREQTGCPVRQAFCPQYCSDHEFCGESLGESHCLCRATFAAPYKQTDSLGDPTVCMDNSATLTLAGCLLAEKGIDYTTLHLNDPDCKGHMDEETHMLTFSINSSDTCGTEVLSNNSQLIYKNAVMMLNSSEGVITREAQFKIDFSCYYTEPGAEDVQSVSFKIKDSSVVLQIESGVWNYTLMMNAYTDPGLMNLVESDTEILLNQPVWVELKTEGLDEYMVAIVTDSCWATSQPSPDSRPRYDLVINGCPNSADPTVSVEGNGRGTSTAVSFRMFEFTGTTHDLYLHCKVELCPTLGQSCAPACGGGGGRKRRALRAKYADGDAALITMAWNN